MIPDFVPQTKEILRQLQTQAEMTYQCWQDAVGYRYRENYIKRYEQDIDIYINGGTNQTGMGLEELLQFIDSKTRELSEISGLPTEDYVSSGTATHDDHLNRTNWNDDYGRPGELDYGDFRDVMDSRNQNN